MSVTLINGDGNPRVLASQDADWYGALIGEKTCIVPINDNLSATITDSNTVEIGSGVCITKEGRRVQIDEGDIEEIIIPTGTQGIDTYYIIGFHLYINELGQQVAETFVETMASATDTITETTFKEGSSSIYVSLYRVKRSGLSMESVTQIIPILKTITEINTDLSVKSSYIGMLDISTVNDTLAKVQAIYGSNTTWIQHSGYVLRGATSGVTSNDATKTGGSDDAIVVSHNHTFTGTAVTSGNNSANPTVSGGSCTISSSGGHTHTITSYYVSDTVNTGSYQRMATSNNYSGSRTNAATIASNTGTHTHTVPDHAHTVSGTHTHSVTASGTISTNGSSGTNANIPNYKSVYIWERIA